MAMRDLMTRGRSGGLSGGRSGNLLGPGDMQSPMLNLRREIENMFEDMFRGGLAPFAGSALGRAGGEQRALNWPSIEINENENEVRINAEVPGVNENDIELTIEEGVLTIRGERKTETEDKERGYSERYYGQFERRIALPSGVDEENAQADFNNGVLSITLRKTQQAERARRIPIGGRTQQEPPRMQQAAAGSEDWPGKQQQGQQTGQTGGRQQGQESLQKGQQTQKSPRSGREPATQPQE